MVYSNDYLYHVLTNSGGAAITYSGKKINTTIGTDISQASYKQNNLLKDSAFRYSYTNLFPKANFSYIFNPNSRISVYYNGNTRQPSINQVQPVQDNNNPL